MRMEFEQVAKDADDIVEWFRSFDLRVDGSRINRYAKLIHEIAIQLDRDDGLNSDSLEHVMALFEYGELSVVHQAFNENPPSGLEKLLGKMVSGPFSYVDESDQNSAARNFGFEANLGSRLNLANLTVSFDHSGDVYSELNGYALYFQCKRLSSLKQIKKRLKAASKHIGKDVKRHLGSKVYGFIGLDVTKVCEDNGMPLIDDCIESIEARLKQSRNQFISDYIEKLDISYGGKVIGILVRNACVSLVKNDESYMYIQGYTLVNIPNTSSVQYGISEELYKQLTNFET